MISLAELWVVVAIIGVLAAVAIPAYQRYQANAKVSVVQASLNNIIKAYNACLALESPSTCATNNINMTINAQPGSTIVGAVGTTAMTTACFLVSYTASMHTGCVTLDVNGETMATTTSDMAAIVGTPSGTAAACDGATAVCTP